MSEFVNSVIGLICIAFGTYYLRYALNKYKVNEYEYKSIQLQYGIAICLCSTDLGLLLLFQKVRVQELFQ